MTKLADATRTGRQSQELESQLRRLVVGQDGGPKALSGRRGVSLD
jgi:hypothetical protein